jgi:class 3 adenylate cyclase
MLIIEYEISRSVMWAFTTPLMLKMYCNANELTLKDINIKYHLITIIPYIFIIPFKNQYIYTISIILFSIPVLFFLKSLYKYKHMQFTNLYILIWIIFILINILEMVQLVNQIYINSLYNIADTLCKFVCNIVISNYNEQEIIIQDNMDLQCIKFISHMICNLKKFENDNKKISFSCKNLILHFNKNLVNKIPKINDKLKLELLAKILPFNLDRDYIKISNSNTNKEFDYICVMFMDIVNYTELANKFDSDIIFKLLHNIYNHFDNIIKKYNYLQKIETIGDAYMIVGDIYRTENNHKNVIKEIILLGIEFIKNIKIIKTPDNVPLCIRIGINMGTVNVGILGNEIPRLCIVGNTVNIASRLQSTAEQDTIQTSKNIYEEIKEIDFGINIEFIKKENVFLKNIGSVSTYNIKSLL